MEVSDLFNFLLPVPICIEDLSYIVLIRPLFAVSGFNECPAKDLQFDESILPLFCAIRMLCKLRN